MIRADRVTDKAIRFVTPEEFAALLKACDDEENSTWWRAFLLVAYCAGLRFGELLNLVWSDIDFEGGVVHVTPKKNTKRTVAWTPKDFERREIPVLDSVLGELAKLQEAAEDNQTYVFVPPSRIDFIKAAQAAGTWGEGRFILNNFHRQFPKIIRRAAKNTPTLLDAEGKPTISLHDLRRSALTVWSRKASVQVVAKLAGHSDIATTMRYYLAITEDQIESVREASRAGADAALRRGDPF